jgi:hypothetical protein
MNRAMIRVMALFVLVFLPFKSWAQDSLPKDNFQPDPAWKTLTPSKSLWFDSKGRRLILRARVCTTEGFLEHLLCLEQTKEHEAILVTDAMPRMIQAGLILIAGDRGQPVRFRPEFQPPKGPPIRITLQWLEDGKAESADAKTWVKDEKTGKLLAQDWVFAGSDLFQDPETKKMIFAADGGDLITVANFSSAILDVPFASSASDLERSYVANTPAIPSRNTYVTLILEAINPPNKDAARPADSNEAKKPGG